MSHIQALQVLKKKLSEDNVLNMEEEEHIYKFQFEWYEPITDRDIQQFKNKYNIVLPESYEEFLKYTNGVVLYDEIMEGIGPIGTGVKILGIDEIVTVTSDMRKWYDDMKDSWIVFADYEHDFLLFDMDRLKTGEQKYIIDMRAIEPIDEIRYRYVKDDFATWLIRTLIVRCVPYWRWCLSIDNRI